MADQDPLVIPVPADAGTTSTPQTPGDGQGVPMATAAEQLHEQNMSALGGLANIAHANVVTVAKAFDYDYLEGKAMVNLAEALGAREVGSERNPGGPKKPE